MAMETPGHIANACFSASCCPLALGKSTDVKLTLCPEVLSH